MFFISWSCCSLLKPILVHTGLDRNMVKQNALSQVHLYFFWWQDSLNIRFLRRGVLSVLNDKPTVSVNVIVEELKDVWGLVHDVPGALNNSKIEGQIQLKKRKGGEQETFHSPVEDHSDISNAQLGCLSLLLHVCMCTPPCVCSFHLQHIYQGSVSQWCSGSATWGFTVSSLKSQSAFLFTATSPIHLCDHCRGLPLHAQTQALPLLAPTSYPRILFWPILDVYWSAIRRLWGLHRQR